MKTQNTQVNQADFARFIKQGAIADQGPNGSQVFFWISGDGVPHRRDGPAVIITKAHRIIEEEWMRNGELHRTDGPATTRYHPNGNLAERQWFQDGLGHREIGPAVECYHPNGRLESESWMRQGELHRTDGPAESHFDQTGNLWLEQWWWNGWPARPTGPEMVEYHLCGCVREETFVLDPACGTAQHRVYRPNGTIEKHAWTMVDELHRDGQPAVIHCDHNGSLAVGEWFERGKPAPVSAHQKMAWLQKFNGQPIP